MVAETTGPKKEDPEDEKRQIYLKKTLKTRAILASLFLLSGVLMLAAGQTPLQQGLGASSCILGVTVTFLLAKTRQQLHRPRAQREGARGRS